MIVLLTCANEALVNLSRIAAFMLSGLNFFVNFYSRLVQQVHIAAGLLMTQLAGERLVGREGHERVEDLSITVLRQTLTRVEPLCLVAGIEEFVHTV